jgi:DNA-binding NtrC family response regulator
LVVDDAPDTLEVLQRNLKAAHYEVHTAPGVAEAIQILDAAPIDLVITDLKMPKASGLDLIRHVRENLRDTAVIMMTGYASIESAVAAVKEGAEDYLPKPFTDEELLDAVRRTLEKLRSLKIGRTEGVKDPGASYGLIGNSQVMRRVFSAIPKAASTRATVLITGESGTGKELVARAIHYNGPGPTSPFVPVNCGGIPEGLVESELFGHVKGSFTGAHTTRAGFFITAEGGTIFLDEISELGLPMQANLLRVLQDHEVQMVGASRPRQVDVRVIAATNKDLRSQVTKGAFREDLFFRLNVVTIEVPPLRERGDDVLLLAQHFAAKYAEEEDKPTLKFSDRALEAFRRFNWPGNVRELENIIQRIVVMSDSEFIDTADLPPLLRFSASRPSHAHRTLASVEEEHIRAVLASVNGNKTQAAKILGIDRKTLREKLKQHGFPPPA